MRQLHIAALLAVVAHGAVARSETVSPFMRNEILFAVGTMPADATSKGLTLYGSYTVHFNPYLGWEALGGMWFFSSRRGGPSFEEELQQRFDVQPEGIRELDALVNSNLVFTPLDGEFLVLDKVEIGGAVLLNLGYAMGQFSAGDAESGVDVGFGLRLRIGDHTSVRLDLREYVLFSGESTEHYFHLSAGLGLGF